MRDSRNREPQIGARIAAKSEIPQERSGRGDQLLRRFGSTAGDGRQQKLTNGLRRPRPDIRTECLEHRRRATGVVPHRRQGHPSMSLIPVRELGDKGREGRSCIADGRTRTEPTRTQVGLKAVHAERRVMAIAATIGGGTVTPSKVPTKRADGGDVQIRQRLVPSRQEHAKVGGCTQVPNHGRVGVAVVRERVRETVDVRAARSTAQPP